jgi:hypothetical protein
VRRIPRGVDDGGVAELTEGGRMMARRHEDGAVVAVRLADAEGVMECSGARSRGKTRGTKKGGVMAMGRPLIAMRRGVGDASWAAPRSGEAWGERGASAAVGRTDRGARGWRTLGRRATDAETG